MAEALDAVALQALDEIEGGIPLADAVALESLADDLHARTEARNDGDAPMPTDPGSALAATAGARVEVVCDLPQHVEGIVVGETLYVRARRLSSRVFLAIIHELAHLLLARAGSLHSHADVWCLALALGAPRRLLRALRKTGPLTVERLVAATGLPSWAAAARLRMGALVALREARGAA